MKRSENTLTYLFVIVITMMVWFWAEANTKDTIDLEIKINFSPPAGSNSIISPFEETAKMKYTRGMLMTAQYFLPWSGT